MQSIFLSKYRPEEYVDKEGIGKYPDAPNKCSYGDCGINLKMKKHGFYSRFIRTITFTGWIRIRRYKCLKCGRTLSMLPSFCLAGFSYSVDFIIALLQYVINTGSINKTVREWFALGIEISRRLISKYLTRIRNNRRLIQYGINQLSPGNIELGRPPGDTEWTKSFLSGMRPSLCPEFNANFQNITGKSFMSLHNKIA
jgi:transposase-like protein